MKVIKHNLWGEIGAFRNKTSGNIKHLIILDVWKIRKKTEKAVNDKIGPLVRPIRNYLKK